MSHRYVESPAALTRGDLSREAVEV